MAGRILASYPVKHYYLKGLRKILSKLCQGSTDGAMKGQVLCLIAWTLAAVVTGSDGQCNSPSPAQLVAEQGKISFLDFQLIPSNTTNNKTCQWIISSSNSSRLRLTAATFDLRSENGSCVDIFTVYDGNTSHSPLLLSTCSGLGSPIYSTGSDVFISFNIGKTHTSTKPRLAISYEPFGPRNASQVQAAETTSYTQLNVTVDRQQYLKYPVNSSTYSSNANCSWRFVASPGYVVHVTFTYIDIEASPSGCTYDFLDVFDSYWQTNKVDTLCGKQTKRQFYSTGQNMYIRFTSDAFVTRTGFNLTYQAVAFSDVYRSAVCSSYSYLTAQVHQPNFLKYPAIGTNYSNNLDCGWLIQSGSYNYSVHLIFLSVDIEVSATGCDLDFVEIFDGSSSSRSLGKICRSQTRGELYSSGQNLFVKFHSDGSVTGKGFHLSYESVFLSKIPGDAAGYKPVVRLSANSTQQYLVYPSDESTYPNNAALAWLFETSSVLYVLNISFTHIDVEASESGCTYDYIEIFDGAAESVKLDRLCGSLARRQYYSSGQSIYITFHSDATTTREGFQITYQAVPRANVFERTVCGTAVHLTAGFHNPHFIKYPENETNYPNNADCGWLLESPTFNTVINVTLTFVDTESCDYDFVEIFDGPSSSATRLAKVCGLQLALRDVYSSGKLLFVKFHSDGSNSGRGFQLSYQAIDRSEAPLGTACSGQVQTRTADYNPLTLQYPASSSNYTVNTDCAWFLQTTSVYFVVHVTFTFLDTQAGSGCPFDYVELLDGSTAYSTSLGKVCGQTVDDFYSSGRYIYIKFHSDRSNTGRGFRLTYQAVSLSNVPTNVACSRQGQTVAVKIEAQTLQYPSSSSNYPTYADCAWIFQTTSYDYVVHVTFTFLDTESSSSCSYDYVELLDGSTSYSSRLGKVCGQTLADFYSSGRYMYIKFHSNWSNTGRGFQLTYQAVYRWNVRTSSTYPSGNFDFGVASNGQVQTRTVNFTTQTLQYPASFGSYPLNTDCAWLLQTTSYDYVVHVTFTFLDTEAGNGCPNDYVELFNGSTSYSRRLIKVCGQTLADFYSSGQYMYIKFHSDSSNTGRGFRLIYQAVPRWNVRITSTYASANFDFEYLSDLSVGAVVGAALGSLLGFNALVTVIFVFVRRRQQLQQPTTTIAISAGNNQLPSSSSCRKLSTQLLVILLVPTPQVQTLRPQVV